MAPLALSELATEAPRTRPDDSGRARSFSDSTDLSLEVLMRHALEVPGAATALLQAFAAQSRVLRMVQEAEARGAASLPSELTDRVAAAAASTPTWLASGSRGVRA